MQVDPRLNDLLALWKESRQRGGSAPPTVEELCKDCPELIPEMQRQVEALQNAPTVNVESLASVRSPSGSFDYFPTIPGYEILKELGQGGMGVVYKARQTGLNRVVAIKMIIAGAKAGQKSRARFNAEAEAVARLQDPHIVQIYDIGEQEGCPYFSLEYINGGSLHDLLDGKPIAPYDAARLMAPLARAIHHAHQRGIIHRDLKPANVLLQLPDEALEKSAEERLREALPKITDFGLAKHLTGGARLTKSGIALGTPNYMAPEQALAQSDKLGPWTDVYGLGAVLYEALTGRPPFDAPSDFEILQQVAFTQPRLSREITANCPPDLEDICLKCLEKKPADRYQTSLELAEDLERFLQGQAVHISRWRQRLRLPFWLKQQGLLVLIGIVCAVAAETILSMPVPPGTAAVAVILALATLWFLQRWRNTPAPVPRSQSIILDAEVLPPSGPSLKIGVLRSLAGPCGQGDHGVIEGVHLAADELNVKGGLLERPIQVIVSEAEEEELASEAERLIQAEGVSVLFAVGTSANRRALRTIVEKHDHLLLYPLPYEGLEQSPHIVYLGSLPNQQILPTVKWCFAFLPRVGKDSSGACRRYFLVGSDRVYSRIANLMIKAELVSLGGECVGEGYRLVGAYHWDDVVESIAEHRPDVIFNTIQGDSNLAFFRSLRAAGITPDDIPTVSFSIGEHELRRMNLEDMVGDYASWSYFPGVDRVENRQFLEHIHKKFGPEQPATHSMEAAYCGVQLWAKAIEVVGAGDVRAIRQALCRQKFAGPGGVVQIDATTQHAHKPTYIARIGQEGHLEIVLSTGSALAPVPYPRFKSREEWESLLQQSVVQ